MAVACAQEGRELPRALRTAPWLVFFTIAALIFVLHSFPSLYGDEYWSLAEARDLSLNPGAVGYFVQLRAVLALTENDWLLRALSLFWVAVSVWALGRWLDLEALPPASRLAVLLLWVTNPFLWVFAQQVRFYAFFAAATVIVLWRFRAWQRQADRRNLFWLIASALLLCTAQFFAVLVLAALAGCWLWSRAGRWKPVLALVAASALLVLFLPAVRGQIVLLEQRLQNQPLTPDAPTRGLSLAAFTKVPHNLFAFSLGKRVYPLWWWVTVPALLAVGVALARGLVRLRTLPGLCGLVVVLLLELGFVHLVAGPLAPPGAPGTAPRHVIFILPAFLIALGVGMAGYRSLQVGVFGAQLAGLFCLVVPTWSDEPVDLMDWRGQLTRSIEDPGQTCVVVDGRAAERVARYCPAGVRIEHAEEALPDGGRLPGRILLASNDHRLELTRPLDTFAESLDKEYQLVTTFSVFPAQITVYERGRPGGLVDFYPSRLDLPEQDLRLPLRAERERWALPGFMRLDSERPEVALGARVPPGRVTVASNYRSAEPFPEGTPVARLLFETEDGNYQEFVLRSGEETAAWGARAPRCQPLASWTKRVHLLGTKQYPGAYEQYTAHIWGTASPLLTGGATRLRVQSLLPGGTFYFWGVFPDNGPHHDEP
jgi:hypothetical protein